MQPNERMEAFFNQRKPDRLPAIEWAPWWTLTMDRWRGEGLDDSKGFLHIAKALAIDPSIQLGIPNELPGFPSFKAQGIINDAAEYELVRPFLFQKSIIHNMLGDIKAYGASHRQDNFVSWLTLSGFFWYPRVLFGIEDHFYSFYDQPELYHRICRDMVDYYKFVLDEVTQYVTPNFMTFAEDMSYNHGPMLSKSLFDTFIKPYYDELIPFIHQKGIKLIIDSDGDVTELIPWLMDCGVDGILPLERQAGVDVNQLTKDFPTFYFIGGFDKMVMKFGREAMQAEFERLLPAMRQGMYIPSVDHQTPPDVSLAQYHIYSELLKEYCIKAVSR